MKTCTKCNIEKHESEFAKHNKRIDGLQSYCNDCKKKIDATYYSKHKKIVRNRIDANRKKLLDWLSTYKKSCKCSCGQSHPATLDFHHRDKKSKDKSIADLVQHCGLARLKKEIAKCDVLCANCHRILHYEEKYGP